MSPLVSLQLRRLIHSAPPSSPASNQIFSSQLDTSTFTFEKGWAFQRRIYFNGENRVMPPPDAYPWLPNGVSRQLVSLLSPLITLMVYMIVFFA